MSDSPFTSLTAATAWHQQGARLVAFFPSGRVVIPDPDTPGKFAIATLDGDGNETIEGDEFDLVGAYRAEFNETDCCPLCLLNGELGNVQDVVDSAGVEATCCETCGLVRYGLTVEDSFTEALGQWYETEVAKLVRSKQAPD